MHFTCRHVYSGLEWMCNYVRLPLTIVNHTATTSTGSSSRAGLHVSTWHVCCGNHLNVRTYYRCEHAMGIRGLQNHILRHWPGWLALLAGLAGWPGWLAGLAGWLGWLPQGPAPPRPCPIRPGWLIWLARLARLARLAGLAGWLTGWLPQGSGPPSPVPFSPRVPLSCPTRPLFLPHRISSFLSSAIS